MKRHETPPAGVSPGAPRKVYRTRDGLPTTVDLGELGADRSHFFRFSIESEETFQVEHGSNGLVFREGDAYFHASPDGSRVRHEVAVRVTAGEPGPFSDSLWLSRQGRPEHKIHVTWQVVDPKEYAAPPAPTAPVVRRRGWIKLLAMASVIALVVFGGFTSDRWRPYLDSILTKNVPEKPEEIEKKPNPDPTVKVPVPTDPSPTVIPPPVDPTPPVIPPPTNPSPPVIAHPVAQTPPPVIQAAAGEEIVLPWPPNARREGGAAPSITRPCALGRIEVSQGLWARVMGSEPKFCIFPRRGGDLAVPPVEAASLPVEMVTYPEIAEFCNHLSAREGLAPYYTIRGETVSIAAPGGPGYRLPTEVEWETAARSGTSTRWFFGDDREKAGDSCWIVEDAEEKTHPCGEKEANAWGFHDILGNVAELCQDDFAAPVDADPQAPKVMAVRGGSYRSSPEDATSTTRAAKPSSQRWADVGFRVARTLAATPR